MLLRLSYLALTGMIRFFRLLAMSNADKNIKILTLRHQLAVLQRHVDKPQLTPPNRALLAALLLWVPNWSSTVVTCDIAGQWSSGMIVHCGTSTAVSDLPGTHRLARAAGPQLTIEERRDPGTAPRGRRTLSAKHMPRPVWPEPPAAQALQPRSSRAAFQRPPPWCPVLSAASRSLNQQGVVWTGLN